MSFVVLFNGHAASGKTTLAYAIAPPLRAGLVTTSSLGCFIAARADPDFLPMRERRYDRALALADKYMDFGVPVILDGTYALRGWRQAVFRRAAARGVSEIAVVTCECHDKNVLTHRFSQRAANPDLPDACANTMDAYFGSASEDEAFNAEREALPSVVVGHVHVDTARGAVSIARHSKVALRVAELLRQHVKGSRRRFLVAFEGIGGSGKTTQSNLLCKRLLRGGAPGVSLCGEFSKGPLGRWIEGSSAGGLRVLPGFASTLSVHATLMIDRLAQLRGTTAQYEWMILDSGWMSHSAHMRAIPQLGDSLPAVAWHELLDQVDGLLREYQQSVASGGLTVFLDCPVDVAIDRVRERNGQVTRGDAHFLERLAAEYRDIVAADPGIIRIDATRPVEEISEAIHSRVVEAGGASR
jgi:thymidylate kinase/predicted kinase